MPGPIRTILPRPTRRRPRIGRPSAWWPSVGTRQDEAFRNIWQALRQHHHVQGGLADIEKRRALADTFVTCAIRLPLDEPIVAELEPIRAALAGFPFVRVAPLASLAITVQELGYLVDEPSKPDEISQERLDEFIRHSASAICDFPQFLVKIGGFNSFLDTPFLDVHDDGWCFRIHHRLRDFTLLPLADSYAYLPHMPLGYYTRDADMRDFPARMARWRDRTFATFFAPAVEILAVPTADPLAEPEVLHCFDLGHQLGAADTINQSTPGELFG